MVVLIRIFSDIAAQFLNNMIETHKDYHFIPQHLDEFHLIFDGGPNISIDIQGYPTPIHHKYYQEGASSISRISQVGMIFRKIQILASALVYK